MKRIAVIGMGTSGKSISLTLAQCDCDVEVITRRGKAGFMDLSNFIERAVIAGRTRKNKEEIISRISWFGELNQASKNVELVIEAIEENLFRKQQLFKKLDSVYPADAILSSNTSSLPITKITRLIEKKERAIGIHFFNPVHIMSLVELIPTETTSKETIRVSETFIKEIGKTPIIIPDQPGFLVNRILFTALNESIKILEEGKIKAENIDLAMKLGANYPEGPLHLADFIGLDMCLTILKNLYKETKNTQYKPCPLLVQKVKDNELGRKTGHGFFRYTK